jgi:AAA+ ATPase superfamily predicted ATPase
VNNFLLVGIRKVGYNKILNVFTNKITGIFVTILIVIPLHEKLLILVLVVCYIYNCFDANWVQQQWDAIYVS